MSRDTIVRLRVTPEQATQLRERARRAGYPTLSAYLRTRLLWRDRVDPALIAQLGAVRTALAPLAPLLANDLARILEALAG